ncbi:MAG: hypothetical protein ACPKPY_01030 [Nitrososphaeraceae archaeon]
MSVQCFYCGQNITFNDLIKSRYGKRIPLNLDNSIHKCLKNNNTKNNNLSYFSTDKFLDYFLRLTEVEY